MWSTSKSEQPTGRGNSPLSKRGNRMYKYIIKYTAFNGDYVHEATAYRSFPNGEQEVAKQFESVGSRDRVKVVSATCEEVR